jgi:hypothetical protein
VYVSLTQSSSKQMRNIVESFHLYSDNEMIKYLESRYLIAGSKKIYARLDDPINMVSLTNILVR